MLSRDEMRQAERLASGEHDTRDEIASCSISALPKPSRDASLQYDATALPTSRAIARASSPANSK